MEKSPETTDVRDEEQTTSAGAASVEAAEAKDTASADAGAPEEAEEQPVDPVAALQEALAQAEAQASEYLDGWQRARAEFANYRRREEQRRGQAATDVSARVLGQFLPVLDDLERAFSSVPPELQESSWVEGLSLVAQKMLTGMEKEGVATMDTKEGDTFDPNYHMAVLHCPHEKYGEGQIAMVLQKGYMVGERVLRPAMVQVSSGKIGDEASAECEPEPETQEAAEE